jgi:hypothetical protein
LIDVDDLIDVFEAFDLVVLGRHIARAVPLRATAL